MASIARESHSLQFYLHDQFLVRTVLAGTTHKDVSFPGPLITGTKARGNLFFLPAQSILMEIIHPGRQI